MYFVAHGEVEILVGRTRIAYVDAGAMIGEIAVAMKTRRTATVRTAHSPSFSRCIVPRSNARPERFRRRRRR